MVVDTSAIVAIIAKEPERSRFVEALASVDDAKMSSATYLEAFMVLTGRELDARQELDDFIGAFQVAVVELTPSQASAAAEAFLRYGKNRKNRARLNFGDCMSYGLAKSLNEPLLFKGDDFARTDIVSAV